MSKYLSGVAALALLGAATFALPATAAERQAGVTAPQSTEFSSQRRYRNGRVYARHYGARRYVGPRYGYRAYDGYGYGAYPYGYYAPPLVSFGVGPFGLRLF